MMQPALSRWWPVAEMPERTWAATASACSRRSTPSSFQMSGSMPKSCSSLMASTMRPGRISVS